jgi:DNA-binding IclR family transcriptional regulator
MAKRPRTRPAVEGVAAADRALAVLTAFRRGDRALTLAELAERTGLVKSTIMRLAVSLERHGLLVRMHNGEYGLGPEALRLGTLYQQSLDLERHVVPVLEHLVDRTEESASFYIQRGDKRLCAYRVNSPHRLRLHVQPGDMLPMDESSIAQVLRRFAKWPDDRSSAGLDLPLYTAGVNDLHTASMSIPILGSGSKLAGALALSGPITRLTATRATEVRADLRASAQELTRALGGSLDLVK